MDTPTNIPRGGFPVCANCGQRPGSVRVVLAAEGGRRAGALCEVCAREFFAVAAAGGAAPEAAANEPQSKTPALDEFGRVDTSRSTYTSRPRRHTHQRRAVCGAAPDGKTNRCPVSRSCAA